jgi:VWFA-related protein
MIKKLAKQDCSTRVTFVERRLLRNGLLRNALLFIAALSLIAGFVATRPAATAQDGLENPVFRVKVDLVVLNVAVTDRRGRYIRELKPKDFRVLEDGIVQNVSTFGEGNQAPRSIISSEERTTSVPGAEPASPGSSIQNLVDEDFAGTNVFVLFDTSNFMYRSFVFAEDAIADFVRGLDGADSVAVYSYSRNLTRLTSLTKERTEGVRGLRTAVAGDETALYNALLLTLRDAAEVPGRKVIIVFSNGPDSASTVGPDDVRAIAEDEGVPIYVISTREVNKDPISSNVFRRLTARTGGKAFFAKSWQKQSEAFVSIREELASSYTLTYRPQPNPNEGWRSINVELTGDALRKYRIRTRSGYRPKL